MDWSTIIDATLRTGVGREAIVLALAAIGLNLHFGFTGLVNFGQVGFLAVGAYGVAISVGEFGLPLWVGVLVGVGAAVVLALLLGLPTLRLRADYLAIATIAVGEIFRNVVRAPTFRDTTGGVFGIGGFSSSFFRINPLPAGGPGTVGQLVLLGIWALAFVVVAGVVLRGGSDRRGLTRLGVVFTLVLVLGALFVRGGYGFGPWRYGARAAWIQLVGWGTVMLAVLVVFMLVRSPWGRVIKAIRDDEAAARSLGKNAYAFKMQSLIIGGVIGAFGGIFQAVANNNVTPGSYRPETTFFAYVALILGGTARIWGPVVGAIALSALIEFTEQVLRQGVDADYIPSSIMSGTQIGQIRFMLIGLGMMLLVIFRPQGLIGDRREAALEVR